MISPSPTLVVPAAFPIWMAHAGAYDGVKEVPGLAAHPQIVAWLALVVHDPAVANQDETPWCSAFVNGVMVESGYPGTGRANARSWLDYGIRLPGPRFGAIAVLWRITPKSRHGHTAFVVGYDADSSVALYGGNQKNRVCTQIYDTKRVLGYVWPAAL